MAEGNREGNKPQGVRRPASLFRFLPTLRHAFRNPIFLQHILRLVWISRIVPELKGCVIDIGSGPGTFGKWYTGARRVVTTDLPATSRLFKGNPPEVWADGRALPFLDGVFDNGTCWEVLEHLPDPDRLLVEAARVLRSGGRLVLSAPMAWELHGEPHDYWRFTPHGIRYLAEKSGFRVREIHPTSGTVALIGQNLSVFIAVYLGRGNKILLFLLRPLFGIAQLVALTLDLLFGRRGHSLHHVAVLERVKGS